jgi:hypothetical protein
VHRVTYAYKRLRGRRPPAEDDPVIFVAVLLGGLALGLLVGRWWVVLVPATFGAWVAAVSDVDEVSPWFLGLAYAAFGVVGALVGVFVRRRAGRILQHVR